MVFFGMEFKDKIEIKNDTLEVWKVFPDGTVEKVSLEVPLKPAPELQKPTSPKLNWDLA